MKASENDKKKYKDSSIQELTLHNVLGMTGMALP